MNLPYSWKKKLKSKFIEQINREIINLKPKNLNLHDQKK